MLPLLLEVELKELIGDEKKLLVDDEGAELNTIASITID